MIYKSSRRDTIIVNCSLSIDNSSLSHAKMLNPTSGIEHFFLFFFLRENQRRLKQVAVYQQFQGSLLELHHALGDVQP